MNRTKRPWTASDKKNAFNIPEKNFGLGITPSDRLTWDIDDGVARLLRGKKHSEILELTAKCLCYLGKENMSKHFFIWFRGDWTLSNIKHELKERYKEYGRGLQRAYLGTLMRKSIKRSKQKFSIIIKEMKTIS